MLKRKGQNTKETKKKSISKNGEKKDKWLLT